MDEKRLSPHGQYDNVELGPMPAIAPDGGFAPGPVGQPPAPAPATAEHMVCLRGPCIHYWEFKSDFEAGNPEGTFGPLGLKNEDGTEVPMPKQINRHCLVHPGTVTELMDATIRTCNLWDPISEREVKDRTKRRKSFLKSHPQFNEEK